MTTGTLSRRTALGIGVCAMAGAATLSQLAEAHAQSALGAQNEETIRKWYAGWEQPDWQPLDALLTDDFTFSSAAGDDHINKATFKTRCWQTQINFTQHFDLLRIYGSGDEAFVLYVCHTRNGKTFRNVEYLRLRNSKIASIECYFGAESSFPSAVSKAKS